ncbi:peptide-methionine (S)-S-oxide reductase MsrA [Dokdonella sp.]|uniref:peptide-methionine (S)-S-oxide reductase MsrA n=1 Tax=Dokdonella sp. TaxID=2291710 RepID=UPI0031C6C6DB|nr:peptide-methionine (S)-S-oxide reductase MsrA [Dokdonella sp.]
MSAVCELPGASLTLAPADFPDPAFDPAPAAGAESQRAVLAGGCFWCTEAVFRQLEGVLEVTPGYSGDAAASARYETVCAGGTNHVEAIEIRFDPGRISYARLLKVFFAVAHDPTQVDRQGGDVGRQYRSAIFYGDPQQRAVARAYIDQLSAAGVFRAPIATELVPLEAFHVAEAYHHDYAARNPDQAYIAQVALPKVDKLQHAFGALLKKA